MNGLTNIAASWSRPLWRSCSCVCDHVQTAHSPMATEMSHCMGNSSGRDFHAAEAGGLHRHLRAGHGEVEALLDQGRLGGLAAPREAFVQPVQAPQIVEMLAGAAELAVEAEIRSVDRLGLGDT